MAREVEEDRIKWLLYPSKAADVFLTPERFRRNSNRDDVCVAGFRPVQLEQSWSTQVGGGTSQLLIGSNCGDRRQKRRAVDRKLERGREQRRDRAAGRSIQARRDSETQVKRG